MNKPLLLSLATAALLGTNLNAESMYEKFQAMELQMQEMKKEIATLKAQDADEEVDSEEEVEADEAETSDDAVTEEEEDSDDEKSEDSDDEDEEEEEMDVEEEIRDMQESISDINRATSGNALKLGVDYRFALDNIQYKMADGSKASNDAFMTNRLWINMNWAATKHLSFTGQLAYNKAFGARSGAIGNPGNTYDTFDWIANENAYDDVVRVRSAYFLYRNSTFFETSVPWTFSIGRRPSTNGHLINLRDDDKPASPMGHSINVEFDGLSSKFSFDKWVDGMYVKFCAGRGMSNAVPKFSATPYAETDRNANPNIDLLGLIFVPYDNGQYGIATQYYYANNLIDAHMPTSATDTQTFDTVGGLHSFTANFTVNGIGNEINDYLDDSSFFLSGAISKTDPKDGAGGMLGSTNSLTGYSIWAGIQMPSVITEDGRWGIEYNKGSQHWRSITYGEDTNIGSKLATRGSAYEAYFTEYLVEDILSLQIRYTYIDYDYTGSNGFFGNTSGRAYEISSLTSGSPTNPYDASNVVDTAQDIRFYLRYKY